MKNFLKIKNYELLSQKVYHALKNAIVRGDIKPSSKLMLNEISESLGVSNTPIREAINKLSSEGFLKIIPNRGIIIEKINIDDIQEILHIRTFLDGLIAKLAAKKITDKEIVNMMEIINKMEYCVNEDDRLAYNDLDIKFHNFLLNITENNKLKEIYNNLIVHAYRFRIRTLKISGRMGKSLKEHKEIALKVKERNPDEANRVSQEHMESILHSIEEDEKKESKVVILR
jgi:DNA-binding GntR family transcriptional regulator